MALEAGRTANAPDGLVLPEVENVLRRAMQADRVLLSIPTTGMPSYSPDGEMVVIGGEQGRLSIWDAATGEQIRELLGHVALVIEPIFSPDGRLLFTAGFDSLIKVWQFPESRQVGKMVIGGTVNLLALNSDASQLAAAPRDGDVESWDISSFTNTDLSQTEPLIVEELILVIDTPWASSGLAYSPDGQCIAILVPVTTAASQVP